MTVCPHIDLAAPETYVGGMPREIYRYLRNEQPIYWHENPAQSAGFWAVTRQRDLDFISKNPLLFSSAEKSCMLHDIDPAILSVMRMQMIHMDPPEHRKFRQLVRSAFTPRKVDSYGERFRQVAREVIDRVAAKGHCEFVEEVASELPLVAICELMGVPQDWRKRMFELTNIMISPDDPEFSVSGEESLNAMVEMFTLAQRLADEHRKNPKDDIVNVLLNGTVEDEPLTDDEFCNFFLLLIVAGNETTRTVTTHGMRLLMEHGLYQQLVDNPDWLEGAIEEFLRYNPAVIAFRRTATADVEVGGQLIAKGDRLHLFYGAASADEAVFDDGDVFDISRGQREDIKNKHRAFGYGEHFCIGSHLARLELKVMFQEILARIRNPRFNGELRWLHSNFINGIKQMPIAFDVVER